jgi:hypothetical protein
LLVSCGFNDCLGLIPNATLSLFAGRGVDAAVFDGNGDVVDLLDIKVGKLDINVDDVDVDEG